MKIELRRRRGAFTLDVEFETDARVTGVFGPSGAGKSTLIQLIAGLERPDRGRVTVDGEPLYDGARDIDVPVHRRRIGVVFQEHRLFPHLSVRGNLAYGRRRDSRGEGGAMRFGHVVELLELEGLLDRPIEALSGGERQRVALGRALVSQPRLLLLDEPLSSLDLRLRRQIIPYLRRVRDEAGVPMLYVSHDLGELLQLSDRLVLLDRGRSVACGPYADLVHDAGAFEVLHDRGMQSVLPARVVRHEPDDGATVVRLEGDPAGREWLVPLCAVAPGARVRMVIQPWDVALADSPVPRASIQNQIRGTVGRCTLHDRSAIVEVDVGAPLIVELSRRSAAALGLAAGSPVVCLVKSRAVRVLDE